MYTEQMFHTQRLQEEYFRKQQKPPKILKYLNTMIASDKSETNSVFMRETGDCHFNRDFQHH